MVKFAQMRSRGLCTENKYSGQVSREGQILVEVAYYQVTCLCAVNEISEQRLPQSSESLACV